MLLLLLRWIFHTYQHYIGMICDRYSNIVPEHRCLRWFPLATVGYFSFLPVHVQTRKPISPSARSHVCELNDMKNSILRRSTLKDSTTWEEKFSQSSKVYSIAWEIRVSCEAATHTAALWDTTGPIARSGLMSWGGGRNRLTQVCVQNFSSFCWTIGKTSYRIASFRDLVLHIASLRREEIRDVSIEGSIVSVFEPALRRAMLR